MNDEEAWEIRERCRKTAYKMGFIWEAEDIAQEAILLILKRNKIPKVMNRLVIDAARRLLGDSRSKKRIAKMNSKTIPLEEWMNLEEIRTYL